MNIMVYNHEAIECMSLDEKFSILEGGNGYRLTEGELGWLAFAGDRFAISKWLHDNIEDGVIKLDTWEIHKCLADDGVDRAQCLDERTSLAYLLWLSYGVHDDA